MLTIVLVAVGLAVFWSDLRAGSDSAEDPSAGEPAAAGPLVFRQSGVPFTFDYPEQFAPADPPAGILWVAGISPVDIVDVRRVADREFSTQGMRTVYGTILRDLDGVDVLGSETRQTGVGEVVIFDVANESTLPLRSRLGYLAFAGSTWQIECQSQAEHQTEIDDACELVLRTLAPV